MQKYKDTHKAFYTHYNETRTALLDGTDNEKLEWFDFYFESIYASYFKKIRLEASILELGCNKGYLLHTLGKRGYFSTTGVDLSLGDLKVAKRVVPHAKLVEKDIFEFLDETEELFDVIVLKALIEHIEKPRVMELLKKIHRKLKQNGIVLIDVYNADWMFSHHDRYMDFTHELGFTQESLTQIMLFDFQEVAVKAVPSPLRLGFKDRCFYRLSRALLKKFLGWVEPEMSQSPILERLLIGYGKK